MASAITTWLLTILSDDIVVSKIVACDFSLVNIYCNCIWKKGGFAALFEYLLLDYNE